MKKILIVLFSINIFNCSSLVVACQSKTPTPPLDAPTQIENKMKNYIDNTYIKYITKDATGQNNFILQNKNDVFSINKLNQKVHDFIFPYNQYFSDSKSSQRWFDTPIWSGDQKWSWFFKIVPNPNPEKNALKIFKDNIDGKYASQFKNNLFKQDDITTNYNGWSITNNYISKSQKYEILYYYHINSFTDAVTQNFINNSNNNNINQININFSIWRNMIEKNKQADGIHENLGPIIQKLWEEIHNKLIAEWWNTTNLTFQYDSYKSNILLEFKKNAMSTDFPYDLTTYNGWNKWINQLNNTNSKYIKLNFYLTSSRLQREYKLISLQIGKEL